MLLTNNYTYNKIYVEADGFRGPTLSINLIALVDNENFSWTLYNDGSTSRWGIYELNLSPTQSSPAAVALGYTGSGLNLSYGEYKYTLVKGITELETGILWVLGQNNTIY